VVPKIAIAPLFVVWLGFGFTPKVLVAVLIAFFPVVISTVTGLKSVDSEMLELAATMGGGPLKTFVKIRFPASLPHLFAGLKVAVTLAVTGAVVGEFVGANEGLGFVILQANGNLDTPMLFAGLIVMSVIGVVLFMLLEFGDRIVLPWHVSRRGEAVTTTL
jgi:NitT/TauT family transport system permease protein